MPQTGGEGLGVGQALGSALQEGLGTIYTLGDSKQFKERNVRSGSLARVGKPPAFCDCDNRISRGVDDCDSRNQGGICDCDSQN